MSNENELIFYDAKRKALCKQVQEGDTYQQDEILWGQLEYPWIIRDVDSGEMRLVITARCRNRKITREIPLDELQPQKLVKYAKFGFPVLDSKIRDIISSWLCSELEQFHIADVTEDIGWKQSDNQVYFQLRKAISRDSDVNVRYHGDMLIGAKGKFAEYNQFLTDLVLPQIETQVIVAFSVASALAAYLNPELTLVLHMDGESTTGKTTMLKLAASVWGSTEVHTNGILQTWNSTKNALIKGMCGISGITLCYDELGSAEIDTDNLIYLFSNGTDKKRMNEESPKKFSVNICSSGEIPLKTLEGVNGTDARLLEFSVQWTRDAQHAEAIKAAINNCYGSLGREFVKKILTIPKYKLEENLGKLTRNITERFEGRLSELPNKRKRIIKRAIEKVAVVSLAAMILKKKLNINFNYKDIAEFMLTKSQLFNLPDDECIVMLEAFMRHRKSKCLNGSRHKAISTSAYAEIVTDNYICIPKQDFYDSLKTLGYSKNAVVNHLKELHRRNIIHCESGKLYNRHKVKEQRLPFIDFDIEAMRKEGVDFE